MSIVSAIIVSYKNEEMTCAYVNEELSKCPEVDHVIIVNNAGTEESTRKIQAGILNSEISDGEEYHGSRIVVLYNKSNQGFAKGNNQGARFVNRFIHSKYLLFTNDDIIINNEDVVRVLIEKREANNAIGCIAPKIIKPNGNNQGPFMYMPLWKRYFLYCAYPIAMCLARKIIEKYYTKRSQQLPEGFYYCLVGCFFMIASQDFYNIGMMDEHTFLYREEEILAERLKKLDKSNYCVTSLSVTHLGSQSSFKDKKKTLNIVNNNNRNSDLYYYHEYMGYPKWEIKLAQNIQRMVGFFF